jgi:hypothetical protein
MIWYLNQHEREFYIQKTNSKLKRKRDEGKNRKKLYALMFLLYTGKSLPLFTRMKISDQFYESIFHNDKT